MIRWYDMPRLMRYATVLRGCLWGLRYAYRTAGVFAALKGLVNLWSETRSERWFDYWCCSCIGYDGTQACGCQAVSTGEYYEYTS